MDKNEVLLDKILFRPILTKPDNDGSRKLVIIFSSEVIEKNIISISGKKKRSKNVNIHVFDLSGTIESGSPVIDVLRITDLEALTKDVEFADADTNLEQITLATSILINHISELTSQIQNFNNVLTSIQFINRNAIENLEETFEVEDDETEGNFFVVGPNESFAHMVFRTVTGNVAELDPKDIERIGGVISEVINNHLSDDIKDPDQLKKIKAEIEFKMVEALPAAFKAGDININMEAVLEEIKDHQNTDDSNTDEEDSGDIDGKF